MPLLNTPNDIHSQLAIIPQRLLPMRRNLLPERQIARHAPDHHLAHNIILFRIRINVLHPPQARITLIQQIKLPHAIDHVVF